MKLLFSSCALAALLVAGAGAARAQVDVGPAPIHTIPASDAQPGEQVWPSTQRPVGRTLALADPAPPRPAPGSESALVASIKRSAPRPPPVALTEDEAAFFTALGQRVTDAAAAYDGYVRHAAAIDPGFNDPASVRHAVTVSADYQPEQLQQGVVAYAAMIALRSPAFVEGVRAQAEADPAFADRIAAEPDVVLQVRGAGQAAADVTGVLRAHGVALEARGKAIGKAAYDIQAQAWSKQPVSDPVEVLAAVKARAALSRSADAPTEKMLLQSLVSAPRDERAGPSPASPPVVRGLAVAALAVMGRAGDREDLRIASLLHDAFAADCLKLAMLDMNQCLAAAGPHYDDVFCVGEHAVGETARCLSTAAGGAGQTRADPVLRVASASERAPAYGSEEASAYGYPQRPAAEDAPAPQPARMAEQPLADAPAYPEGDGTLDGQIYTRRAQRQAASYAYQNAPPPRPAPQPRSAYAYPYGPPGGGYAPQGYDPPAQDYGDDDDPPQ